jgi:hypothetical protein
MGIELKRAHKHSANHRGEIECSELCGCFYCEKVFSPVEIKEWIDGNKTAMCPHCGIDAVIGSASGFVLTKEFLHGMCDYWFS